ncbi:MAG: PmbA/TldA family metallopeptidase, partial [Polymorphobacter sp.]
MTIIDPANIFYRDTGLDPARTERLVTQALNGCDDGELYLQHAVSESFAFDDGRLKAATFNTEQGFGLRGVAGETTA